MAVRWREKIAPPKDGEPTTHQRILVPAERSQPWAGALVDLSFPPTCPSCCISYRPEEGARIPLCPECSGDLRLVTKPFCRVCGEPYGGDLDEEFRCTNCRDLDFAFDFAVAKYRSIGPARDLIHRLKYQSEKHLRLPLALMMLAGLHDERVGHPEEAVFVPVPMHPRRLRKRGFNQAYEIARTAATWIEVPVVNCLRRTAKTIQQAHLGRDARLENLEGVFGFRRFGADKFRSQIAGRTVIIVDDVLTTGATAHHVARVLRENAEPDRVIVATSTRA